MSRPIESLRRKILRILQLSRALRFVWEGAKGWAVVNGMLTLVQGVLPLLQLYLVKLMVDAVSAGVMMPDKDGALRRVLWIVGATGAVALLVSLLRSMAATVRQWQSMLITDHMNDILLAKSILVDLEYYENPRYYDTLHRAQREASSRPINIVNGLAQIGQSSISLLAIAGLLLLFNWVVTAVLLAAVVMGTALRLGYTGKVYDWQKDLTAMERKTGYFGWLLTDITHAKEIRLFEIGPVFIRRLREIRMKLRKGRLAIMRSRSIMEFLAETCTNTAIYGSYAYVAYQTVSGEITLGSLVMYFSAFQRVQACLQGLLSSLAGLYSDNLFLANLYEFLDLERTVAEPVEGRPVPQPMRRGIVLNHVNFQYPAGTRKVLEDVSLTIRPGEVVALVGENGSGKTTLIKLLCRLYDPSGGTITIDGVDLRQFATKALRREISIIFQDYVHYHMTARENIWLGNAALPLEHERVIAAACRSGADDVIRGLPKGYDTILGRRFESGEELSIGEWQKVALARAFMRDAQVLVLDEPTSSMDAKAEYEVFQRFRELVAGRTAILISHRFSTVRMADHIYVMEQGRIIEGGTHDELVRLGGTYARLFEMQARHYR